MNRFIFLGGDMHLTLSFCLALSAATLSVGESGALLVGMRDASGPAPWMTASNVAYAALGAIALSCGLRAAEYASGSGNAFCANGPLLGVDLLKLALAAGAVAATVAGK
jgi:hypothetical protein